MSAINANAGGVLLASGGLDSTTLAYWLLDRGAGVTPLFLDYGQHCAQTEHETLLRVLPSELDGRVERIDISDIYRASPSRLIVQADLWQERVTSHDLYLPYRNLLFLAIGAAFAQGRGIPRLYSGFIDSNHAIEIDCSSEFFGRIHELLVEYGTVEIKMPFRTMTKSDVARIAVQLGVPIGLTYSCQVSATVPCGACPNCRDRIDALASLTTGITDTQGDRQ